MSRIVNTATTTHSSIQRLDSRASEDVFAQVAEIHRSEISEGFLSTLGPGFLMTLYKALSDSEHSFLLCYEAEGRVQGFIVGATDTGAVYKEFFRRAGWKSFTVLVPKLFSVARIKRILETLFYPKKKRQDDLPEPEILNFCVRAETQGQGVGSKLFEALCEEFRKRGVPKIRIVTGETQKSAQQFYEAKKATLAANIEVHKDTQSRVYVYDIQPVHD